MITKIRYIKGIGRFKDFSGSGVALSLKRNTFIFGKNTHGKSTLTAVLRSLEENNPLYITERRTFGTDVNNPEVIINTENEDCRFQNNAWSSIIPVKVFDGKYITNNIYNNDFITDDKQERISNIILGSDGRKLEKEYIDANAEVQKNAKRKTDITTQYNNTFDKSVLGFKGFRDLQEDEKIEEKIADANGEIKSIQRQEKVKEALTNLSGNFLEVSNFDTTALEKNIEVQQEKVKEHIEHNIRKTEQSATSFLSTGFGLLKNADDVSGNQCVFCAQDLSNAEELMDAYSLLFSEEYKNLNKTVGKAITLVSFWKLSERITEAKSQLQECGVTLDISDLLKIVNQSINTLNTELAKKKDDLNYTIDFASLSDLKQALESFKDEQLSSLIEKYDKPIEKTMVNELNIKLKLLILKKNRYEDRWVQLCDEYKQLENSSADLSKSADGAFQAKKEYADSVFEQYNQSINAILETLGASFRLTDFQAPENQRGVLKLFNLSFLPDNAVVALNAPENEYGLQNTLSDSDKRLLAFAFFVTDIQNTENLSDYVIILDDPMSSFDDERKLLTAKLIKDGFKNEAKQEPVQIIVLTHENNFLKMLNKLFVDEKTILKIEYSSVENKSELVSCNFEEEFGRTEYQSKLLDLKRYLDNEVSTCDLGDVRLVLESLILTKYFLDIEPERRKRGGAPQWYLEQEQISQEIKTQINDLLMHLPHHPSGEDISVEDLGDGDRRGIVSNFISNVMPNI